MALDKCCENPSQCWEPCGDLGKSAEHAKPATLTDMEREILRKAQNHVQKISYIESELEDVRRVNRKLGDALREIYRNNGEDEGIARICNDAFRWADI